MEARPHRTADSEEGLNGLCLARLATGLSAIPHRVEGFRVVDNVPGCGRMNALFQNPHRPGRAVHLDEVAGFQEFRDAG